MKLKIEIDLDSDAFVEDRCEEIKRIVNDLCERLPLDGATKGRYILHDSNGNFVGTFSIDEN